MKFRKYKLEDVCNIQIGKTPRREVKEYWGKGYSWVSISDMKSRIITTTKEEITESAIKECGCKLIPEGTILMSFKLSIGKLAFAGKDLYTNEAIVGLEIKDKKVLHPNYLLYVLKNIPLIGSNNAAMGATLNKESLKILQLPVPSISDQLHIANLLSNAENLITQRKQSIALLDEFLKSTFLEMFGTLNDSKYQTIELELISKKITDGTHVSPKFLSEGVPFLLVSNIINNEIDYNTKKYISEEEYLLLNKRTPIEKGDILLTSVGSYGNPALVRTITKFAFQRHIAYIKPNHKKINNVFLFGSFKSDFVQMQIEKVVRGVAQKTLNLSELRKLKIPVPPVELQTQFAQITEKIEALKAQYQSSLQELENLYGSISQRAFRGELILNRAEEQVLMAAEPEGKYNKQ